MRRLQCGSYQVPTVPRLAYPLLFFIPPPFPFWPGCVALRLCCCLLHAFVNLACHQTSFQFFLTQAAASFRHMAAHLPLPLPHPSSLPVSQPSCHLHASLECNAALQLPQQPQSKEKQRVNCGCCGVGVEHRFTCQREWLTSASLNDFNDFI